MSSGKCRPSCLGLNVLEDKDGLPGPSTNMQTKDHSWAVESPFTDRINSKPSMDK